jgi:ectoine hydroxylase-related dioxygenase (phytanoyl-CoA dioxygenase family)
MTEIEKISDTFDQEGFCIVRDIITEEQISNVFDNIIKIYFKLNTKSDLVYEEGLWKNELFHEEMIKFRQSDPGYFSEMYDSCQSSNSLSKVVLDEKILDVTSNLLKCKKEELSFSGNMTRMDVPGDTKNKTAWHQEIAFVRNPGLVLWIPLVEITEDIGPLHILERSHANGEIVVDRNDINQYTTSRVSETEIPKIILDKYKEKSIKIDLGDALFFDTNLIHSSGTNTSKRIRFSSQTRFFNALSNDFAPFREKEVYNPHAMQRLNRKSYD